MMSGLKPRQSDLVVQDLKTELLIYDLRINKVLCLNETATIVWRLCNGERTAAEISKIISKELKSPVSEDFVWLAVEQLKRENLLADPNAVKSKFEGLSRREIVKKVGLATMIALPVISSVVAPAAVNAQSGNTCLASGQQFCLSPQSDFRTCINAINAAAVNQCCVGTLSNLSFGTPQDPNACCGTCGIEAP